MKLKIINGPNLNMLGYRDPIIYGKATYQDLENLIKTYCTNLNVDVVIFQSNYEGAIVDEIQDCLINDYAGIIINPGALTHYSYAIRDALEILPIPKIEVHLSNINNREAFRKISVIEDVVDHRIIGEGTLGYLKAIDFIYHKKS